MLSKGIKRGKEMKTETLKSITLIAYGMLIGMFISGLLFMGILTGVITGSICIILYFFAVRDLFKNKEVKNGY